MRDPDRDPRTTAVRRDDWPLAASDAVGEASGVASTACFKRLDGPCKSGRESLASCVRRASFSACHWPRSKIDTFHRVPGRRAAGGAPGERLGASSL